MNETTPIVEAPSKSKKSPSPWLILGGIWLCISCAVVLCGGFALLIRERGNVPALFATAVPTVDVVQVTTDDPAWTLVMDETFSSNKNDWDLSSYENDSVSLERSLTDGKYIWAFEAKSGWNFWDWPSMQNVTDFTASVDVHHTNGSKVDGYGLVMRVSGGNFYVFEINDEGRFEFQLRYLEDYSTLLTGKTKSIQPYATNQVTVQAIGSHFTIYVNNVKIGEADDATLKTGKVGLLLSPSGLPGSAPDSKQQDVNWQLQAAYPSTFELDNFKVWTKKSSQPSASQKELLPLDPRPGSIVYVTDRDGNLEIYSSDSKGIDTDRLTNNLADDYSPEWSPDGRRIVFVSEREGNPEIFLMNRDGSKMTRLTDDPADDLDPSWSPDGKQIVFASNRDGNFNLYKLDIETKSVERLAEGGVADRYPDWSPNGKYILFQSERKDDGINFFSLELATGNIERLTFDHTSSISHPNWSPNGYSYINERRYDNGAVGLVIRDYPNKNLVPVISDGFKNNTWPAWSPDGAQIIFISNRDGQTDIYIISKDGKSIYRLTNDQAIESELDWTD